MVQVALVLDEHSTRSPLIDYAVWWQRREAAEYLCWVRDDVVPSEARLVPVNISETHERKSESMQSMLDLRLRNVTYFKEAFNPEIIHELSTYADLIGLCRKQFNDLYQAIELGKVAPPRCPIFVPSGFPPPTKVLVHLNCDAVKAAYALSNLLVAENQIVLLAFDDESPASQKKIVQYAQAHFEQVGLTHPGQEVETLALNFLPKNALVVASLRTYGQSRRLIRQLLKLPDSNALSFLLIY